jgi:hypothetical protein
MPCSCVRWSTRARKLKSNRMLPHSTSEGEVDQSKSTGRGVRDGNVEGKLVLEGSAEGGNVAWA